MTNLSPRRRAGQSGAAGIGKKVENPHRPSSILNQLCEIIPVDRLFREQAGVLEPGRADMKLQVFLAVDLHRLQQRTARLSYMRLSSFGAGSENISTRRRLCWSAGTVRPLFSKAG